MLVVLMGVAMGVVDGIVVSIALPTITRDFSVNLSDSQWIITGYLVTETSLLLIFGRVSEYTGRWRLFLAGFALFTASSLACGLSATLPELIIFRILQATGAAMVFSISSAIIFEVFPEGEQGRAMGYIGATIAIASIAAPILGGFITDSLGWQYIFLINVPIGLVLLGIGGTCMKFPRGHHPRIPMDWIGAITLVTFMAGLILLLSELAGKSSPGRGILAYSMLCFVSLGIFLIAERRHPAPLLDLRIFDNRRFLLANSSMILLFIAFFMLNIIGPFYLEVSLGLTPSRVGLVYLIAPIVMVIASPLTGWLYDRFQSGFFSALGIALAGASLLLLGYAALVRDLTLIIAGFVPLAVGSALFQSANNVEIMRSLPIEKVGTASSISATVRNLGMTLGVSVASILLTFGLAATGYQGSVEGAGPGLLSPVISRILILGAIFCAVGAGLSLLGNRTDTDVREV
ncbi:MAG: MFS transporter [Methanoregulaceae archaeon]|nr:MFS transporter [Methanoregulaceae archaeon]